MENTVSVYIVTFVTSFKTRSLFTSFLFSFKFHKECQRRRLFISFNCTRKTTLLSLLQMCKWKYWCESVFFMWIILQGTQTAKLLNATLLKHSRMVLQPHVLVKEFSIVSLDQMLIRCKPVRYLFANDVAAPDNHPLYRVDDRQQNICQQRNGITTGTSVSACGSGYGGKRETPIKWMADQVVRGKSELDNNAAVRYRRWWLAGGWKLWHRTEDAACSLRIIDIRRVQFDDFYFCFIFLNVSLLCLLSLLFIYFLFCLRKVTGLLFYVRGILSYGPFAKQRLSNPLPLKELLNNSVISFT